MQAFKRPLSLCLGLALWTGGCAVTMDPAESGERETVSRAGQDAVIYFHGMVYSPAEVMSQQEGPKDYACAPDAEEEDPKDCAGGQSVALVAPNMFGANAGPGSSWNIKGELPPAPWERRDVRDAISSYQQVTAAGFSLGRVPLYRLLERNDASVTRAVVFDPCYSTKGDVEVVMNWLAPDSRRRFLFVYGPRTNTLAGKGAFEEEVQRSAYAQQRHRFFFCPVTFFHDNFMSKANKLAEALGPGWEDSHCRAAGAPALKVEVVPCAASNRCYIDTKDLCADVRGSSCVSENAPPVPGKTAGHQWHCSRKGGILQWCGINGTYGNQCLAL